MQIPVPALILVSICAAPTFASSANPNSVVLDIRTIEVGDSAVKGKALKPFSAKWSTKAGGQITESARVERVDGRKCLIRDQVFPMQQGLEMHSELVLDAKTLETVSFQRKVVGLPPGAGIGDLSVFARWEFDGSSFRRSSHSGGPAEVEEGSLSQPMFDGSGLGLVIAALPLKKNYVARLPVSMALGLNLELARYWVDVRVVGKEPFSRKGGKDVHAWIVEVDWLDFDTGEVTSAGGASAPGGAYYVVPKPPSGFPHVPRYANENSRIEYVED